MSTLGERIRMIRKAQTPKVTQAMFAEALHATPRMIYTYETDRVVPDETFKALLCKTYNIDPYWLESGEGEMMSMEKPDDLWTLVQQRMPEMSPFAKKTIVRLLQAPPEAWDAFMKFASSLLDEKKDPE